MAKKIDEPEFNFQVRRHVQRLMYGGLDFDTIERYINEDINNEKQAQRMIEEVIEGCNTILDELLYDVLEVLESGEKLGFSGNNIVTVYPHPTIENNEIIGVEYKTYKNYFFEDEELFNRYIKLLEDIEQSEKRYNELTEGPEYVANNAAKLSRLKRSGMTYKELAKKYNSSIQSVRKHVTEHRKRYGMSLK